ncbi:acyl-CoA thioesterase/BAAT N-terminal domain-containing protein [Bacillus sp. JCM 19034]|uniref:acyl-CoA thioesterase/BAAT N-terminal domain-containing protein n=1 Tax=Bacillus sp. JCM 19034 TaxID=1481928 RepID=UPI0007848F10|nr:acyl-CoA thioesterase/BAAT N-terminal domain-containing protein [Bacillus sp. JCM 19034]
MKALLENAGKGKEYMRAILQISQIDSYIDEDVEITVSGCLKNEKVTIHATMYDEQEKKFSSFATFIANDDGVINVATQKPIEGTYHTVDCSGLFWSMECVNSKHGDYFEKTNANKVDIELSITINDQKQDAVTIHRYFYKNDVKKVTVQEETIRGVLFHPEQKGQYLL